MTYRVEQRVPINHRPYEAQWVLYDRFPNLPGALSWIMRQREMYQNAGIEGEFRVIDERRDRAVRHTTSSANNAEIPELGLPTQTRSRR